MTRSVALRAGGVFVALAVIFFVLSVASATQTALAVSMIFSLTAVLVFILASFTPQERLAPVRVRRRKHR